MFAIEKHEKHRKKCLKEHKNFTNFFLVIYELLVMLSISERLGGNEIYADGRLNICKMF
jgi:hypothetical protein